MGSPHDGHYQHVGLIDLTSPSVAQPGDPANPFSSVLGPSQHDIALAHASLSSSLFSKDVNPGSSIPVQMDFSGASAPHSHRPMDIGPVDSMPPPAPLDGTPSPGVLSAFQHTGHDGYLGDSISDISARTHSSPGGASASSYASNPSSPAIPGVNPGYSIQPTSIASALDNIGLPDARSRSASSASPGHLGPGVDLVTPSTNSGPPTSQSSGFHFPPSDFDGTSNNGGDGSFEIPGGPHLMVVGDMLKKYAFFHISRRLILIPFSIMHTANSARQACSLGHSATAGVKIDELKKTIALVSELIAATRLVDGPSPPSDTVSPVRASPPRLSRHGQGSHFQQMVQQKGQPNLDSQALDSGTSGSPGDTESRKRCASNIGEDRVLKALKLEPQEDQSMLPPIPSASSFTFTMPPSGSLSPSAGIDPQVISAFPSTSASQSRPASSHGTSFQQQLNLFHPSNLTPPATIGFQGGPPMPPAPLNLVSTSSRASIDFSPPSSAPATHTNMPGHITAYGHPPEAWAQQAPAFTRHQHHHSLSGDLNGNVEIQNLIMTGSSSFPSSAPFTPASSSLAPSASAPASIGHPPPRMSRSNSLSASQADPFAYAVAPSVIEEHVEYQHSRPPTAISPEHSPPTDGDDDQDSDTGSPPSRGEYYRSRGDSMDFGNPSTGHRRSFGAMDSLSTPQATNHSNEVPQEYRGEVDRVFFEFLNKICSNLEATDSKGEPIHQTLMAKKMQRLDESPDFRPFKFRIQAFTNAFLEELAKQGYPEDKIPMKKIRNYLWNSSYISRFNEDGKKAKSKGNHIWNIEAKKATEGGWHFRPFHRRLAGLPPGVAYVGLRWSWAPRIWDPQASRNNLPVNYSSPALPTWLSWDNDSLTGVPTPDAQSCDVTVEARFVQDGKDEFLSQTVHIAIAPMSNVDTNFAPSSRRPSLAGESSRRIQSDSVVSQASSSRAAAPAPPPLIRSQASISQPHSSAVPSQDAQVIQVLTTAAQRVAQEAQSQVVASGAPAEAGPELQALAKQQHVLTVTAQAVDQTVNAQGSISAQPSNVLATAAQQVVLQAARQVAADRSALAAAHLSAGLPPLQSSSAQVTVNEVSVATQSAVAQAVEITGPLSSEVDVLMTASSLLQQQTRAPVVSAPGALNQSISSSMDPLRPHSTGTMIARPLFAAQPLPPPPLPTVDLMSYSQHS
ncbi:hypothetical protein OF83DRAFT_1168298 [Amylostereum chailletii]|nr:hypothetical protein OF83DRAFT_1168298 [Amylostereum chailletii]